MANILCVDDELASLTLLSRVLRGAGHQVVAASDVDTALEQLRGDAIDLVISDYMMPGLTGLDLLGILQERGIDVPLILVTGYASIEHAVASLKAGAFHYITKPVRPQQLEFVVDQALEFVRLRQENEKLRQEVQQLRVSRRILGDSPALHEVLRTVEAAAPSRAAILIQGESGTGKELIARAIHDMSGRPGPFVSINGAALPETLVESTLFGHERGAFTGAVRQTKGAFERAHRGTLLLDEISEMRLDLQAKLLRVLQEQEFERVGGSTPIRVDVRVVATTNRDLEQEVAEGRFRRDLYYRLAAVPIRVPPLRDRREDIPLLAQHFARLAASEMGKPVAELTPGAIQRLRDYSWPGNVRELAHVVQRAVILSAGTRIDAAALELPADAPPITTPPAAPMDGYLVPTLNLAEAEAALIGYALRATNQNRTRAAALLGIDPRTLRTKLNRPKP